MPSTPSRLLWGLRWRSRRLLRNVESRSRRLIRGPNVAHRTDDRPARRSQHKRLRATLRKLEAQRDEDRRNAFEYSFVYRQLASAVDGLRSKDIGRGVVAAPSRDEARDVRRQILAQRDEAVFTADLARGHTIEQATADYARAHLPMARLAAARTLCESLAVNSSTAVAGHLGWGIIANRMAVHEKAWHHFSFVPEEHWRRWAPAEYFDVAFAVQPDCALGTAERLLSVPPSDIPPVGWLGLARRTFAIGRYDLAHEAMGLAKAAAAVHRELDATLESELSWLSQWIERAAHPRAACELAPGSVPIAVLDYKGPDYRWTSRNIGDYIQTVASLGHLVRRRDVAFSGPEELVALARRLHDRIPSDQQLVSTPSNLTLVPVNRDASSFDPVPDGTWLIAFGWYMHALMEGRFDFPFHPGARPIFISFHCRRRNLLSDDSIEYLRRYGPVGCRDWSTVYLLLSVSVPAFFSGCITTTIGMLFPDEPDAGEGRPTAYVDVARPRSDRTGVAVEHSLENVRSDDLGANLRLAVDVLDRYRHDYSRVVTSRLHSYLPARAIGTPADFVPKNHGDLRFNGLLDLDDGAFAEIRDGINEKLASTVTMILDGASEREIYSHWRSICAVDVAVARKELESVPPIEPPTFDVASVCARIRANEVTTARSHSVPTAGEVDLALALDGNLKAQLEVVVEAITANTERPVRLWILCRGHGPADFERFGRLFPEVTCTWLPCDHVDYGEVIGILDHTTESTLDRLLLPELLPELDRVVYLDIDILPIGDIGELYDWDLRGTPAAARSALSVHALSGYHHNVDVPAKLLPNASASRDLCRRMFARHPYDFETCNAGVMVLDLARMRDDEFARHYVPFVERYGMHDQQALNCYLGSEREILPPEWNHMPTGEHLDDPKLIHWAGVLKPWDDVAVPVQQRWVEYQERLDARKARNC